MIQNVHPGAVSWATSADDGLFLLIRADVIVVGLHSNIRGLGLENGYERGT